MTDDSARLAEIKQWLDTIRRDVFAERYGLPRHAEHVAWLLARLEQAEESQKVALQNVAQAIGDKDRLEHEAEHVRAKLEQAERERDALREALTRCDREMTRAARSGYTGADEYHEAIEAAEQALRGASAPRTEI